MVLFNHSSVLINTERVPMLTHLRKNPTPLIIKKGQHGPMLVIDVALAKSLLKGHLDLPISAIFNLDEVKSLESPFYAENDLVFAQVDESKHFVLERGKTLSS